MTARAPTVPAADYRAALLGGRGGIAPTGGRNWSGLAAADRHCWLGFDPRQARRVPPRWQAAGHARPFAVHAPDGHLDLLVGGGPVDDDTCARWPARARSCLHRPAN